MKSKLMRWVTALVAIALVISMGLAYKFYRDYFASVVDASLDDMPLYIATGSTAEDVLVQLDELGLIKHKGVASTLMARKLYSGSNVEPGVYRLREGMSLNAVINSLRGGYGEETVRITFHTARTLNELAGKAARTIEADSVSLSEYMSLPATAKRYGFNSQTFLSMFLPDTYYAQWDTDPEAFVARMADEYKRFWTDERVAKARKLGMSQSEVSTMASLVQAEQQSHPEERPVIAGLYLNRLRKGMKLQSDPTVVFAVGDFTINRVLNVHLSFDSPYNTYKYPGLPPGPINVPQKNSIDAVLNADQNDYIFMCAKADFSGYHAFARDLSAHNRNAAAYRKALNERKIYK